MNDIKILLVDDDDVDAEMVIRGFRKSRIANEIIVAEDGIEALEVLRANGADAFRKPYIVLLDLNMPRMSGFDFLEELRRDDLLKDSIVFVLTTSRADTDRARSYAKNVAGYLVKSDVGPSFKDAVQLLQSYWTIVTMPV